MYIFLKADGTRIDAHLDHVLKSYRHSSMIPLLAIETSGDLNRVSLRDDPRPFLREVASELAKKMKALLAARTFDHQDTFLLEIFDQLYVIAVPVYVEDQVDLFLSTVPFFMDDMTPAALKKIQKTLADHKELPVAYEDLKACPVIGVERQPYLGQLIFRVMSEGIYIGKQHFKPKQKMQMTKWGKDIPLEAFQQNTKFINGPLVRQLANLLALKQIEKAVETYEAMDGFREVQQNGMCPFQFKKYQLISMGALLCESLSATYPDQQVRFSTVLQLCVHKIHRASGFGDLLQGGAEIIRTFGDQVEVSTSGQYSEGIRGAIQYIEDHFGENIDLSQVADQIPMNRNYLSTQFKKEVGKSFTDYLNNFRVKQAQLLIKGTDASLTDIAHKAGFGSSSYFTTVFKKHTGHTPSGYARRFRNVT